MKFDWERFKKEKVVVNCKTKEESENFFNSCELNGIVVDGYKNDPDKWENTYKEKTCYNLCGGMITYCKIDFYKNREYEILNWSDYMKKEYTIQEVFSFEEGTEFLYGDCKYRINNSDLEIFHTFTLKWGKSINPLEAILKMKFTLVEDKKVSFEEAIQAYGKEVYCKWVNNNGKEITTKYKIQKDVSSIKDQLQCGLCSREILEGEWYIKGEK